MQEVRNSNTVEITEERAERVVLAAVEEGITESTGDMITPTLTPLLRAASLITLFSESLL